METVFILFLGLTIIHFIYESILLPTIRLEMRYRFFAIRDQLFNLRMENETSNNKAEYDHLELFVNSSIRHIHTFTLTAIFASKKYYDENPKKKEEADKKFDYFKKNATPELLSIHSKLIKLNMYSLTANIFMLILYFLPFVLTLRILRSLGIHLIKYSKIVQRITFVPEPLYKKYSGSEEMYC